MEFFYLGGTMKTIGILGAMDMEIIYIRDAMEVEEEIEYAGFNFYVGSYKGLRAVVSVCGMGKVNASCCAQILAAKFNVTHMINFGIAGSLQSDVHICDIVVGHNVTYHDVGKMQMKNTFPFKEEFIADEYLEMAAIEAFSNIELKECNYHVGRIVTGDRFILDKEKSQAIIKEYNPKCVEMEGAAIAHVAFLNKIPSIVIRGICSNSNEKATEFTTELDHIAAYNVARFTMRILDIIKK